ncbi:hypothetical protein L6164_032868 [Bauhinia variegata]|uniref:Uncharacterized protein n=1 Tax=Bauhinia variegata TaxID=167791 RepID=A0ACB9KQ36_BAUVA|nr:hypothetical protein L6164_032868 [Bauhinia variegata]
MQQGDDGRGAGEGEGGGVVGNQDRRSKAAHGGDGGQGQLQRQQQQPQKCPRCESANTKFCYYNNYSLSQPRYFCKTCRRYWTQGGTLRNVPVGGGCRKGKRAKTAASSSTITGETSSRSLPQEVVGQPQPVRPNIITSDHPAIISTKDLSSALVSPAPALGISPYYQSTAGGGRGGGGFLSSLAAIQLNPSQPSFNQGLNVGTDAMVSSNLGLLTGFNVASLGPPHQIRPPSQFFQMGNREREVEALFPAEQRGLVQSTMATHNSTGVPHHDWSQSFITNANDHRTPGDGSFWSTISTSSISGNSESNANSGSSSLFPNRWPDLPGYGPPP